MNNKIGVSAAIYDKFGIEEAFNSIKEIGFQYIELGYAENYFDTMIKKPEEMSHKDIDNINRLSNKYGVQVYALSVFFYLMHENAASRLKKVIDVAASLNASTIVTDTGDIGPDEEAKKQIFYKEASEIADYARSKNINICFEIHGGWHSNGKQGAEIIKTINHPNIRLNYDTANVIFFDGGNPEEDLAYAIPYMSFMHLKDKIGGAGVWNFPALGDGEINFIKIFKMLKDYDGPISVEIELPGKTHTLEEVNAAFRKSYDFLKQNGFFK